MNTGSFMPYLGTYTVPDPTNPGSRVREVEANKNFYFLTGNGTYRLDSATNVPRLAGAPAGLSGQAAVTGTSGFMPVSCQVAYRIVFGYEDLNQQLVLGAPSSRIIVVNTSTTATANVNVSFQIPKEIQASPGNYFWRAYRSAASATVSTEPADDMAQVATGACTGAATQSFTDVTTSDLTQAELYTNNDQEGIAASNYRPPWATDICLFKQYTFYANTRTEHIASLNLLVAGAANGTNALVPGNTITFTSGTSGATFTLTAGTSNNFSTGTFAVSNTANPAADITATASNICLIANGYASNTFIAAYYTSGEGDLPGMMEFDRLDLGTVPFTITSNNALCWQATLPLVSSNNANPNRIYFSKINQPESVPLANYIDVGSANKPINRIIALRDGVMVMKQDGVFRISNNSAPFTVTPVDYNTRIIADNTAYDLDNNVYFLSDQGVVALSDSDTQIMSFVLDSTLIQNTSPTLFPNLQATAWAVAYQSARKYILFLPTSGSDVQATQQYVYNHLTVVWTTWSLAASCGIVNSVDGKLYLGSAAGSAPGSGNSYVYQERKSFTSADYADNEYAATTTTTGLTNTIVIPNPTLPFGVQILPKWTVQKADTGENFVIAAVTVGMTTTTLTLKTESTWAAGAIKLFVPIATEVETVQIDCQNPGMNKQFSECDYIFTEQGFNELDVSYTSDTTNIPATDIITPNILGGWGIDPYGEVPWGGGATGQGKRHRYIPQKVQRSGWIYINIKNQEAFTSFGFSGIEIFFKNTSSRNK